MINRFQGTMPVCPVLNTASEGPPAPQFGMNRRRLATIAGIGAAGLLAGGLALGVGGGTPADQSEFIEHLDTFSLTNGPESADQSAPGGARTSPSVEEGTPVSERGLLFENIGRDGEEEYDLSHRVLHGSDNYQVHNYRLWKGDREDSTNPEITDQNVELELDVDPAGNLIGCGVATTYWNGGEAAAAGARELTPEVDPETGGTTFTIPNIPCDDPAAQAVRDLMSSAVSNPSLPGVPDPNEFG